MALKSTFRQADIRKALEAGIRQAKAGMLQVLKQLGDESVRMARANASELDATGRLAASIGYVIVADGVVTARDFIRSPAGASDDPTTDADEAATPVNEAVQGESLAYELAARYKTGFALIVVSGSEYAVQAESMSNDILTSAEMYVAGALPQLMERIRKSSF